MWPSLEFIALFGFVAVVWIAAVYFQARRHEAARIRRRQRETPVHAASSERDLELARLQGLLAALEAIPAHRRADELADERAETIRALIASVGAQ